jgi:putative membrane protein|tara:strand:- start:3496 stop:4731 length:1236 start_codon:yes stop_codon:yes gene_type:complete
MLIEIILFLFFGIFAGTITGLIPGIHINLIGAILVSLSVSLFYSVNSIYIVVFIVAMAITHTFVDFIPSVFLGCPDTDTELSILPGHELLKQGKGYEAILLTCYGSLAAIFILVLIFLPSVFIISKTYNFIEFLIPFLLILISSLLIFSEKNKFSALLVFLLAGFLGLSVLNMTENSDKLLLPLLTGLFGSSSLLISIKNKFEIPKQKITKVKTKILRPLMGAVIASPLCSFLPGLGSGQAAIIGNSISNSKLKIFSVSDKNQTQTDKKEFLVLLGATNTLVMGFSFITLYIISKTRTGAAVAVQQISGSLSLNLLIFILGIILISGIISFFLAIFLAKFFSQRMEKINYAHISLVTLLLLVIVVILFSGFIGLAVLIASTFTGIYSISLGVRRTNMMGCLMIPTIILYLI